MITVEWNEKLSTGVQSIDEDHKKLFDLLNTLIKGWFSGLDDQTLLNTLTALKDYTSYHFSREEEMLARMNSPSLDTQHREHQGFIARINELEQKGLAAFGGEVLILLVDWLTHHILETDQKSFDKAA